MTRGVWPGDACNEHLASLPSRLVWTAAVGPVQYPQTGRKASYGRPEGFFIGRILHVTNYWTCSPCADPDRWQRSVRGSRRGCLGMLLRQMPAGMRQAGGQELQQILQRPAR